jgi:hypothetical protein
LEVVRALRYRMSAPKVAVTMHLLVLKLHHHAKVTPQFATLVSAPLLFASTG